MNPASSAYYDIDTWTDEEICHVLESSGTVTQVHIGIFGHDLEDVDDERWDDWRKPEYVHLRRAVLDSYLFGIYVKNLTCEKWHQDR